MRRSPKGEPGREPAGLEGLGASEVEERIRRGQVNDVPRTSSRPLGQLLRANLLTRFNALLGSLFVVILVVGPPQDALFGGVLVANAAIGIVQELRAKRTLDRLAVLSAPRARVVREGTVQALPVAEVVLDDVLDVGPGDQVVVDGVVLAAQGLEADESLLTGEAEPVAKAPGDELLSGSFVAAGTGRYRANRVGRDAYAHRLAEEARRFTLARSELRAGIDVILRAVTWAIVPIATLLALSQLRSHQRLPDALRSSVAGVVAMVPEGLVLLTSVAFAVAVVRLGRRQALVQDLPAVEVLARVDVVCVDKTGTLTQGDLTVEHAEALGAREVGTEGGDAEGEGEESSDGLGQATRAALGALAAVDPRPNASLRALRAAFPAPGGWRATGSVAFSSARKWSAASFDGQGTWVLGAPEVVLSAAGAGTHEGAGGSVALVADRANRLAASGRRVLLLATTPDGLDGERLPAGLRPVLLLALAERVRPEAPAALRFFADQGVRVKVISGDHPATAAAVAGRAGLRATGEPLDARQLAAQPDHLGEVLEANDVFGRVTPEQKRAMIRALQANGHVVAMTGDGVNDVLALKDADIGVAMGSGSEASRAVAQVVLLDGSFATLPAVVAEGRRVIANIERVAALFVTKTAYALLLALAVGVARLPFPFLPRHLTLVGSLTIGIPAFFLSLAPAARRAKGGFVRRVVRFAAPAGLIAALATFAVYGLARQHPDVPLDDARSTATLVLAAVGMAVLVVVARPLSPPRLALVAAMAGCVVAVLALPPLRTFFALDLPPPLVDLAAAVAAALAVSVILILSRIGWLPPPGG